MDSTDDRFDALSPGWFLAIDGLIAALVLAAAWPAAGRRLRRHLPLARPAVLRALVVLTLLAHLGEAVAAARKARAAGLRWRPWALQTALVGLPSTLALQRAVEARSR